MLFGRKEDISVKREGLPAFPVGEFIPMSRHDRVGDFQNAAPVGNLQLRELAGGPPEGLVLQIFFPLEKVSDNRRYPFGGAHDDADILSGMTRSGDNFNLFGKRIRSLGKIMGKINISLGDILRNDKCSLGEKIVIADMVGMTVSANDEINLLRSQTFALDRKSVV